ncbi:YbaB/EbfC family nucleoid-associated protein [Micromonospora sp. SH-82]|uniref:YbaB/EbfC family nucleoid-associated protein n=1 Tax=Micromonospora sp. SH-82 TaxID=3132938 RepID=UPI003EB99583
MWADEDALDAAARRLDDWETTFAGQAQRAAALATRVQQLTGTAHSPDRLVTATVDASGHLIDLRLDDTVRRHPATHTARQILQATRAAYADLVGRVTEAARDTLGDDPAGQAVVESYRRRLASDQGGPDRTGTGGPL